jgi:biotin operon repressor
MPTKRKKQLPGQRNLIYLCPSKKEAGKHILLITDASTRPVGFYEVTPTPDSQYGYWPRNGKFITSSACPKNLSIRITPADFDIWPADFVNDYLFEKMLACYQLELAEKAERGIILPALATPNQQELEMCENSRKKKEEPYWVQRNLEQNLRIDWLEKDNENLRKEKKQYEANWALAHRNNDNLRRKVEELQHSPYQESITIQKLQKEREELFTQVKTLQYDNSVLHAEQNLLHHAEAALKERLAASEKALTTVNDKLRESGYEIAVVHERVQLRKKLAVEVCAENQRLKKRIAVLEDGGQEWVKIDDYHHLQDLSQISAAENLGLQARIKKLEEEKAKEAGSGGLGKLMEENQAMRQRIQKLNILFTHASLHLDEASRI